MTLLILVFGLLADCLVAALIGILGSRRRIGFGWAFFLSVLFTPLIGLIITLVTDQLPSGERRWGCLGALLGMLGLALLAGLVLMFLGLVAAA